MNTDELIAELEAYRNGLCQLAIDVPGPNCPRIVSPLGHDPWVWLQQTHQGIPVWICASCVRISVGARKPAVCVCCGGEDTLSECLHPAESLTEAEVDAHLRRADEC